MKQAVVVDLDGTLLKTNTFSDYIAYSFSQAVREGQAGLAFRLLWLSLKRKLRLIPHAELKQGVLSASSAFMEPRLDDFVRRELKYLNTELLTYLQSLADVSLVLATSAPESYSSLISNQSGFEICLATATDEPENRGEEKARRVADWLQHQHLTLQLVVTDHFDDRPLLELCDRRLLVNPSRKTLQRLSGLKFEIFEKII